MQVHFLVRGLKKDVDEILKFIETRALYLPYVTKEGANMLLPINLGLRYGAFGTWEVFFPEEYADLVFSTLELHQPLRPDTVKMRFMLKVLRLAMHLEPMPEFKTDKKLFIPQSAMQNVQIIPIGIKRDEKDYNFPDGRLQERI